MCLPVQLGRKSKLPSYDIWSNIWYKELYISQTHLCSFLDRYSTAAWKALQCKYYEHEGGVRRILVYSMAFPVSEIHRMQVQAGVMQARVKVGWGKSWNCATRKSPNHTAFYSFEATLCVENVSINMVIYMLYNTNAILHVNIYVNNMLHIIYAI